MKLLRRILDDYDLIYTDKLLARIYNHLIMPETTVPKLDYYNLCDLLANFATREDKLYIEHEVVKKHIESIDDKDFCNLFDQYFGGLEELKADLTAHSNLLIEDFTAGESTYEEFLRIAVNFYRNYSTALYIPNLSSGKYILHEQDNTLIIYERRN